MGVSSPSFQHTHILEICILSYHIIHVIIYASLISYFKIMHIGSPEGVTLLDFKKKVEDHHGTPQPVAPKGEEHAPEELPECPDHRPTLFLKGKPQSILRILCFYKYHLSPLCLMH